jgi:hypothetical protein
MKKKEVTLHLDERDIDLLRHVIEKGAQAAEVDAVWKLGWGTKSSDAARLWDILKQLEGL